MNEEQITAVVDRIVDSQAVLLAGEEETEVTVPVADLPAGVGEGGWVRLRLGPPPTVLGPAEPEVDRDDLRGRMQRLRRDRGGGRFGCG